MECSHTIKYDTSSRLQYIDEEIYTWITAQTTLSWSYYPGIGSCAWIATSWCYVASGRDVLISDDVLLACLTRCGQENLLKSSSSVHHRTNDGWIKFFSLIRPRFILNRPKAPSQTGEGNFISSICVRNANLPQPAKPEHPRRRKR